MAKKKRKHGKTIALVIILALTIYFSVTFFNEWTTLSRLEESTVDMRAELDAKVSENENLKEDIDFSGTSTFIERMAREIFGMVKDGEKRYVDEDEG